MFDLSGKTILVAGGSGYLGVPICKGLLQQGARLVLADAKQPKDPDILRSDRIAYKKIDLADEARLEELFSAVKTDHGRLDVAVNLTFSKAGMAFDKLRLEDWERGIRTCLGAAFLFSRAAGNQMAEAGRGSIIQFSSMYGIVSPDPRIYANDASVNPVEYGVAKAGILQMVRYQAVRWATKGVRVNAVVPGAFPNEDVQEDTTFIHALESKTPMGRIGQPEDLVGIVTFLASDESSFVTGQHFVVDGGWTIW